MQAATQQHHFTPEPHERLLRISEVADRTGFKSTFIYFKIKQGDFPPPVKVGAASRWRESDVQKWILDQINGSQQHA
jgi:prophage regulatory protein